MVADLGARRPLHLAQKRVHLLGPQAPAGADRAVAGHGGEHMIELALESGGGSPFLEAVDEIREQLAKLPRSERRRRFANGDRAGTERLDDEPELLEELRLLEELGAIGRVEVDDFGRQHDLPFDAARRSFALQPLVDEALMRGMLIDDDETVARLRDDVILMELGARRAERKGFRIGRAGRFGRLRRDGSRRARGIVEALLPFGKAEARRPTGARRPARGARSIGAKASLFQPASR